MSEPEKLTPEAWAEWIAYQCARLGHPAWTFVLASCSLLLPSEDLGRRMTLQSKGRERMSVILAPDRSLEQRMTALIEANRIRTRRAHFKRDLKARKATATSVVASVPEWAATMKIFDLLLALPTFGRVKVNKILKHQRVSPSKTLGGLSPRQRGEILDALAGR